MLLETFYNYFRINFPSHMKLKCLIAICVIVYQKIKVFENVCLTSQVFSNISDTNLCIGKDFKISQNQQRMTELLDFRIGIIVFSESSGSVNQCQYWVIQSSNVLFAHMIAKIIIHILIQNVELIIFLPAFFYRLLPWRAGG